MNKHTIETIKIKKITIMKIYKKTEVASRQTINNQETSNFIMDMINHNIYTNKIINNIQNKNKKKNWLTKIYQGMFGSNQSDNEEQRRRIEEAQKQEEFYRRM